jgi:glutaredoxin 3
MAQITMYSTEPCGFCRNAKALLASRGIAYEEINLAKDPDGRTELARRTGLMTFPQIVIDGETLGGFRELVELDRAGGLTALRSAA